MSAGRLIDTHGHAWPVTGAWCRVCAMPLIVVTPGQATHPTCDPMGGRS